MNKNEINKILRRVKSGKTVKFNTLRSTASAVGIKTKAGVKTDELITALKNHIDTAGIPVSNAGRPRARPEDLVGYKVKIGLRYATKDGNLVTNMREGDTFTTTAEGQKVVDGLLKAGKVRVWGGSVRAKMLPRYSLKK